MFSKKKESEVEEVTVTPAVEEVEAEPAGESVLDTEVEVEKASKSERVSGGKQVLGLLAFIVLIAGAITMIVNFGLGYAKDASEPQNWVDLVPIILTALISVFTYIVLCVVSRGFVKGKGKATKITYWVSTIVAYAFILISVIIDIVSVVNKAQGKE